MRRILACATLVLAGAFFTAGQAAAWNGNTFHSPTGNIRCGYVNQAGVACITLNNRRGVLLRSFDRAYYLSAGSLFLPR